MATTHPTVCVYNVICSEMVFIYLLDTITILILSNLKLLLIIVLTSLDNFSSFLVEFVVLVTINCSSPFYNINENFLSISVIWQL